MEAKITPKPATSEAEVAITVPMSEFKPFAERAVKKLSEENPIKGFRPGKVPLDMAITTYGTERILHEALDRAMPHFYVQAILDQDIEAIGRPAITVNELSLEKGLSFTATVAVLPEVTLGDAKTIAVTKRAVAVTDEEIEKELKYLAKMRSTPLEVARPAKIGDTVTVDFKVSMNGTVMEGGESKNHPIHIGEGHFVPDFEKNLEGISASDEREFTINFPADYAKKDLQSKQAQVWVKAHAVQQRMIPDLNDDFAKKLGKFDSLADLTEKLKANMQHEKEHKEEDRFHGELSEKLAEAATFGTIPEVLIEREVDRRIQEFSEMLAYQQKTVEDYLAQQQKTMKDIRAEMRDAAVKAVKVGLALRAFAEKEEITVDDADIEAQANEYLRRFTTAEAAEANIDKEELKENLASTMRNRKALERLASMVNVTASPEPATTAQKETKH